MTLSLASRNSAVIPSTMTAKSSGTTPLMMRPFTFDKTPTGTSVTSTSKRSLAGLPSSITTLPVTNCVKDSVGTAGSSGSTGAFRSKGALPVVVPPVVVPPVVVPPVVVPPVVVPPVIVPPVVVPPDVDAGTFVPEFKAAISSLSCLILAFRRASMSASRAFCWSGVMAPLFS